MNLSKFNEFGNFVRPNFNHWLYLPHVANFRHAFQRTKGHLMKKWIIVVVSATVFSLTQPSFADGPIIAFGAERQEIRSTPILERDNRPLHFYGNTVRRRHARQTHDTIGTRSTPIIRLGR
jgi:hypothetical protein